MPSRGTRQIRAVQMRYSNSGVELHVFRNDNPIYTALTKVRQRDRLVSIIRLRGTHSDMPVTEESIRKILEDLSEVRVAALAFFGDAVAEVEEATGGMRYRSYGQHEWDFLSPQLQATGETLRSKMREVVLRLIESAKLSPLLTPDDLKDATMSLKAASAALRLKRYERWETEVLHDEGTVLGVRASGQSEEFTGVEEAKKGFDEALDKLVDIAGLLAPGDASNVPTFVTVRPEHKREYRPNTAFIIMQINDKIPELEDIKNAIKEVFKGFGIEAMRSDEIEHEDVITARILDEISTSEFLIADLTGERPSVYYEVGYAHALGKRPILYRRAGTTLHFDLAVHNVPEYENITDLRRKLRKRLATILNRKLDDLD